MLKFLGFSLSLHQKEILHPGTFLVFRYCSDEAKKLQEIKNPKSLFEIKKSSPLANIKVWNEKAAIRRVKKSNRFYKKADNIVDFVRGLQSFRSLPTSPSELIFFLKKRLIRKELLEQQYLPERTGVLKPDLAAAHFLITRGGSIKLLGKGDWIGRKGRPALLPNTYVPGYYIEAIDAEGTNLFYEGLKNLSSLKYLKSMSLKGLNEINDWCLDWISKEYIYLENLDISNCKAVTYRGLACFYRFECLKTLNLTGVPDTPELKLACLMLLDIMPELDIQGIDLTVPEKIDPVNVEEIKNISSK